MPSVHLRAVAGEEKQGARMTCFKLIGFAICSRALKDKAEARRICMPHSCVEML